MKINAVVLIPNKTIATVIDQLDRGVFPAPDLISERVVFGREYQDSTAYSFMIDNLDLLKSYPEATLIGAWDFETGEQIRPVDKRAYLNVMPDLVEHAEDGTELSRTRPTELSQVILWAGQKERQFDQNTVTR